MKAKIAWKRDVCFSAESGSGHNLTMDGPPNSGGKNQGPRPMEMILMGMGGCAAYDVVHILGRGRVPVSDCVAQLEAERSPDVPSVFTKIRLHFVVSGPALPDNKVSRAVKLSAEKYCSASIMLQRGGVEVEHSYEVVDTTARDA
ncbi:MAG: OsmC family protein [Polyangiaceae bacterium]|nr:OsmC family protein [Polyangiaceae bacterium]